MFTRFELAERAEVISLSEAVSRGIAPHGCRITMLMYTPAMGQPLSIPPGFESLPVKQQVDYVRALWKKIATPQEVPSPEWHREVVRKRLAEHRANPDAAIPWEQVRAELLARVSRRG